MNTKHETTKIMSISSCPLPECYKNPTIIFGLGDDGKVYFWNDKTAEWLLNVEQPPVKGKLEALDNLTIKN